VISRTVADPALSDDQRIALIKDGIFHLSTGADQATIRALRPKFLDLPAIVVTSDLNMGLLMARENIWHWFYPYEQARTDTSQQRTPPVISNLWEEAKNQL
jgi:hypothetical protein